ncbi:MAG: glutamine-hydrolyzing carbamoyl-phosphate synthase small subunit [Clostridiales bacterium]|jgi:carbamoyl-phosphate synthase small subunit|nr:glutamine-hydrolyzing carbamoyl-phosphate synthase small subunit [Clostridiales bacterium]
MPVKEKVARLVMENGSAFEGRAFGSMNTSQGEVVFTTGMTGYQETLTDPSFAGQIVCMTYPLIGNYGLNLDDMESAAPRLRGFIVREKCDDPCNWRCEMNLDGFLRQHGICGIEGIDTRALTKLIRRSGTMLGAIVIGNDDAPALAHSPNLVAGVSCKEPYSIGSASAKYHLAIMDFGVKTSILRELSDNDCKLSVFPAHSSLNEICSCEPDAVFLTNGPGDPKDLPDVIETVKALIARKPVFGICLGHQLISLACGCDTAKLKFGHHGGNHPVKDLRTGQVCITSQNHNYVVSNLSENIAITHVNVNDGTIEGVRHTSKPVMSVQFHPEASPGPVDARYLFKEFLGLIKN